MRVLHVDPFSGASGDMLLGALVDAGADVAQLRKTLEPLGVDGWDLQVSEVTRGGLRAVAVQVHLADDGPARRWADIRSLLTDARLDEPVRRRATAAFARLAEAEARIHANAVDEVVFHEVGGVDAIIDVVGVCTAVHLLGVERITCGPIPLGGGTVRTAHGVLPVPAPAVLELLGGVPVRAGPADVELCTPTGAALLAELVDAWESLPQVAVTATGYGAGSRELEEPNILRVMLGDSSEVPAPGEQLVLVEATIDDMSGELAAVALDALRAAGARDAWARQVLMKKGRPGVEIVALAGASDAPAVRGELFRQSTTLGVREHVVRRWALDRALHTVEVSGHPVRVKVGRYRDAVVNVAPEFDDCAEVAARTGEAVKTVIDLARAAWHRGEVIP